MSANNPLTYQPDRGYYEDMTATQILETALRIGQVDLFDEYFSETEQPEVLTRTRKARELGFLKITDEGIYELTAKGSAFLGR